MPEPTPTPEETDAALRTLARLVAPYVRDLLKEDLPVERLGDSHGWNEETAEEFVHGLNHELLVNGVVLFSILSEPPHSVNSVTLADFIGLDPRALSGRLLRPLRRRATEDLGLPEPWTSARVAPQGEHNARTVLRADGDVAGVIHAAFERKVPPPPGREAVERLRADAPLPSAVFVFRPEYADGLDEVTGGNTSCLRDSAPGTRAVIYRAADRQAVVAMFDVEEPPEWDSKFGWMTRGTFIPLSQEIRRVDLLRVPALESVFHHIQGRRRLPPDAQVALATLIEDIGETSLPPHSMAQTMRPPAPAAKAAPNRRAKRR